MSWQNVVCSWVWAEMIKTNQLYVEKHLILCLGKRKFAKKLLLKISF